MTDQIDEIIARHDAATACGCSCCDTDYAAYVERKETDAVQGESEQNQGQSDNSPSPRGTIRDIFENLLAQSSR